MKTLNKLSFGFDVVENGQKSSTVNALPTLIANSTQGKFTISAPVSKFLNIAVGETVMFVNNMSKIEEMIQKGNEDILAYAQEKQLDLNTREGVEAVIAEFTAWGIAKGVYLYDKKTQEPIMASERITKEDKQKYLDAHAAEIVAANRDELVAQFGELSDEELATKLTVDMVNAPKYHVCKGSRTATTSTATGVGCPLNFTDSAIWTALKADLGENMTKKNRVFDVRLDQAITSEYFNGKENVSIVVVPLDFKEDTDPIMRGVKAE